MPVPTLDDLRRPALELLAERGTLTKISEVFELLAPRFHLTEEERHEMLPSGTQRKWNNRVNWSCFDLYKAGLLDRPRKGYYQINEAGRKALADLPGQITRKELALDELNKRHQVEWKWLKGHAGHGGNERCDQLAQDQIAKIKKEVPTAQKQLF